MQCRSTHICGVKSRYGTKLSSFRSSAASCCSCQITEPPHPPLTPHSHTHLPPPHSHTFTTFPPHTHPLTKTTQRTKPGDSNLRNGKQKMEEGGVVFLSFSDSQYREISFSCCCVCAVLLLWHKWQSTGGI
jgi:hypothetical protein